MNIIPLNSLYTADFSVNVINGLKKYWKNSNVFSCLSNPKKVNMLLYLDGLKAEYTKKDSAKIYAESGDIVYTPIHCEYSVRFYDFESKDSNTIGVNFLLYDEDSEPFIFADDICIFKTAQSTNFKMLFSKIDTFSEAAVSCPGRMKAGMYDILSSLSEVHNSVKLTKFDMIAKGISYLENNTRHEMSIAQIAKLCNVSTSYFRRLFKEYANVSPIEYILNSKIEKAKIYLEYENLTIGEISDLLGFTDAAYFSKQFKRKVGMTPMQYKNRLP